MGKQEILENNKLLAKFMGGEFFHRKHMETVALWHFKYWQGENSISHGYTFSDKGLVYHKDWNWLMPIIEKIEELGFEVSILFNECSVGEIIDAENFRGIFSIKAPTKIEAVWKACVEFVKQYQNKKENE